MKFSKEKIVKSFMLIVIFLSILCCYSYVIFRLGKGNLRLGVLGKSLVSFATFPTTVKQVLLSDEIRGIPPNYVKRDPSFKEMNNLTYNLYGLNSFWNIDLKRWEVRLFNFKNDAVLHTWHVEKEKLDFSATNRLFPNAELRNSLLAKNKSLITSNDETANLMKIDANSNVVWRNHEMIFHHSLNFDADSNIWVCTRDLPWKAIKRSTGVKNLDGRTFSFMENYITKIDQKTGHILFNKGVSQILIENGYSGFVYGFSNPKKYPNDPMHLNDIEPVLEDAKYWKKGDVFFSIRHRSLVMLYRPSTNQVIRLIYGPFINQHDVDIISDEEISIFNNNYMLEGFEKPEATFEGGIRSLAASEILIYNFSDSTFRPHLNSFLEAERVKTYTQGLHEILSNGDTFVEAQNFGKLYLLNETGFVMKKEFQTSKKNYVHRPTWIRLYETLDF
ncbi:arylsulfotransferase family protein [Fulvivirgaceae bacterium BMA12]|uniref:Arylsulfotransferase family protein n=1 Tax=Agaribacillus aureus TaxID=3051825 RepID=A0ABT8LL82_9BACT|nr:arylsulfotransferase family protein [Fulvivirgaceae bacterium BMA12]